MNLIFKFIFFVIINKIKCEEDKKEAAVNEEHINEEPRDNIPDHYKVNIERRFLDDLDDYEWHVAHLRGAQFDGRRDCMEDTFSDKVRRYRRMLKNDGALVEYVSSEAITVDPAEITQDSCKVDGSLNYEGNVSSSIAPAARNGTATNTTTTAAATTLANVTKIVNENIAPTTAALNFTHVMRASVSMAVEPTTPAIDLKATTIDPKPKTAADNDTLDKVRRSEYMFSSIEYYDESIEFDPSVCPDAVEAITLEIDQLRSYDLECEMTIEWRSLE